MRGAACMMPRNGRMRYLLSAIMMLCFVFLFAMVIYAKVKS